MAPRAVVAVAGYARFGSATKQNVLDNYGAKGTADTAMRAIKPGGVYLVLPGGNGGGGSKHPKAADPAEWQPEPATNWEREEEGDVRKDSDDVDPGKDAADHG